MRKIRQVFWGKVILKKNSYFVIPFLFDKSYTPLALDAVKIELQAGDIVSYEVSNGKVSSLSCVAASGSALADVYQLLSDLKISPTFSEGVLKETEQLIENPGIEDSNLLAFRDKAFVTIDNEDSRDLDQALFIEKKDSCYCVYYALADGACYIRPGMALFNEALERGSTYYFPGFSVPMLPAQLSEGLLSLNPKVDRRAFIFIMDVDFEGEIQGFRCVQGLIHSRAKLSYNGVQSYYDAPESSELNEKEYTAVLDLLKQVGEIRSQAFRKQNRIQFQREETRIHYSDDGDSFVISLDQRNDCSRYNEQLSLMCNIVGARILFQNSDPEVQAIYKVHSSPDEDVLTELQDSLSDIIKCHGIADKAWFWDKAGETLADYMDRLYSLSANSPLVEALERQVLLSMRRSMFASQASEHYALAVNLYSRFSSPMREIVGIFLHKEALEKLKLIAPQPITNDLDLRDKVIEAGNRSRNLQKIVERKVLEVVAQRYFSNELLLDKDKRRPFQAIVLGIKATRLYVRLENPLLELKVYTKDLENFLGETMVFEKNKLVSQKSGKVLFKPGDQLVLIVDAYKDERWRLVPSLNFPVPG